MQKVAIIGAGISGMSAALNLAKMNYDVTLYDKYNPSGFNIGSEISFNYTINLRGRKALERLGLWGKVELQSVRLSGRIIHLNSSMQIKQDYSPDLSAFLYSIPRNKLVNILFEEVQNLNNVSLKLNNEVINIGYNDEACYLTYIDNVNKISTIQKVDFTVVTDGVNSNIRNLFPDQLEWTLQTFPWDYKEFKLTPQEVESRKLDVNNLHIWTIKEVLCVGIPNQDSSISLLYCDVVRQDFFQEAGNNLKKLFGEIESVNNFKSLIVGKLNAVKLNKWFIRDKIVFLGDSAHGIFPFYGQGMNASLEDSRCLSEMLKNFSSAREKAFEEYYNIRKPQTDILLKLSNDHFFMLRNKGKSVLYNAKHRLDIFLHTIVPKLWFHEYSMMSNSQVDITTISQRLNIQKLYALFPPYWIIFLYMLSIELLCRVNKLFK